MSLHTAIELGVFDIIAKAGGNHCGDGHQQPGGARYA
ncbi:hypothetical protein TIFTF001_019634 [Ficus carica]|uniref:Uncharacterized protein n=1 Tax=Ficus carica TaxID=3494 RepID=A0AA88DAA8_FICCA|nr:hypothetical protein TIFTF001_019634 [Ficus carica]